jgi:hypothetical protein
LAPERIQQTAELAAQLYIDNIWSQFGFPTRIVSDRDPRFTSAFWQTLWRTVGTKLNMSTAGYPQTDGQSERSIRTFVQMLRCYARDYLHDWHKAVPFLEYAYNDSVHASTGYTPFFLETGQHPLLPMQLWTAQVTGSTSAQQSITEMRERLLKARAAVQASQREQARVYNRKVHKRSVTVGDYVFVKNRDRKTKLEALWVGPFVVKEKRGKVVTVDWSGRRLGKVNESQCKLFPLREEYGIPQITELRAVQHRDESEEAGVVVLEVGLADGQWVPAIDLIRQQREQAWQPLADHVDETRRATGLRLGSDALGCKVITLFPGYGPTLGMVIEYDAPEGARDGLCYRILYPDGDTEDISEVKYRRQRKEFLKGSQSGEV